MKLIEIKISNILNCVVILKNEINGKYLASYLI
jgi:hypothetical protein